MLNFLGMPVEASSHAAEIDHMIVLVHWLMLVLFVGWGAFFLFVIARFRRGANPKASYTGAKGKFAKSTEIAVAIIEVALLLGYAFPAWATRMKQFPSENEAVVVRVIAHQFAWEVHYAGADGKFGRSLPNLVSSDNLIGIDRTDPLAKDDIVASNQLTIPVNRPILVHLTTQDVIHSFGLVEMRVKQDAVPGLDIPVWFIPTRTGEYEIACSQLCGLGHFRMRGFVQVKTDEEFRAYLDQEAKNLLK